MLEAPANAAQVAAAKRRDLGAKSITLLGSIALTVNNISGPGMLEFPAIFQVRTDHELQVVLTRRKPSAPVH